jgi:3-phosphoshikimate 1-carboxyvinyltransferase
VNLLSGWSPRGQPTFEIDAFTVVVQQPPPSMKGVLPPSKSHLIRWALLAAQGPVGGVTRLEGVAGAAGDAHAMRKALVKLGVPIEVEPDAWLVTGVGPHGFQACPTAIHCENSGTAMRLLSVAVTRIGSPTMLDGDASLRRRGSPAFWASLAALGVQTSHGFDEETLPLLVKGPLQPGELSLDVSKTSQNLSALLLSMPAMEGPLELSLSGNLVSRRHAQLSFELAARCGSANTLDSSTLVPWSCEPPSVVQIPRDGSHVSFLRLFELLHGVSIDFEAPAAEDSIGAEILAEIDLQESNHIDLRDANDLITPLAAAMALGGGGQITGAGHAQLKESARITRTVEILSAFGILSEATADGLQIEGGQVPSAPSSLVSTHGDHRLQMTAVVLATRVGAEIEGQRLHEVSFPDFLKLVQP